MSDRAEDLNEQPLTLAAYEAPRLVPIGNLRDILAGPGSLPCENGAPQASGGDEAPMGGPGVCAPE
jgi:hypothetical protein